MSKIEKYLWLNSDENKLPIMIYLDEKGNKIYGNIITNTNTNCSKNGKCIGIARTHLNTFQTNVGLTDIKPHEYLKMMELIH
tara:strand:- start:1305 stop:1550 length:246 start_codon:yes stop_codon:yes gene_type:complete